MPNIEAIAISAPVSVDDVTLTKSGLGVVSVKTGNGANQAVILNASGLMAKNLLDITTAYPAGDGSAITNLAVSTAAVTYTHTADTTETNGGTNQVWIGKLQTALKLTKITSVSFKNGSSVAGNVNVAVYFSTGAKTGSTLQAQGVAVAASGTNAYQTIALTTPIYLNTNQMFFLAIARSGTYPHRDTGAGTAGGYGTITGITFPATLPAITDYYEPAFKTGTATELVF